MSEAVCTKMPENIISMKMTNIIPSVLSILCKDKTTKENIIWATDSYVLIGEGFQPIDGMDPKIIRNRGSGFIRPRVLKNIEVQATRTKKRAEVFTPSWIVNKMNNHCDEVWFERPDVFNKEDGHGWVTTEEKIIFPEGKTWMQYIDSRRLEITCGEAPYLVSRYDAATGEIIPLKHRIGILDRKLRVVNENAKDDAEWLKWAIRAVQSVYGYEFQGDNLLVGRINVMETFNEYFEAFTGADPDSRIQQKVANIIAWNLWQMDGLTDCVPFSVIRENQMDDIQECLWECVDTDGNEFKRIRTSCLIRDWRANCSLPFSDLKKKEGRK